MGPGEGRREATPENPLSGGLRRGRGRRIMILRTPADSLRVKPPTS